MVVLERKDVLIVDDDETTRSLLCAALARAGLTCDSAGDGLEALERLARTEYAVVLTDLMMPRLDGVAVAEHVGKMNRIRGERPIVLIITSHPGEERLSAVGDLAQAIIRKPLNASDLSAIVASCVKIRAADAEPHLDEAPQRGTAESQPESRRG